MGTTIHRNKNGQMVGKTIPGLVGTMVYHGTDGTVGRTTPGILGGEITEFDVNE